MGEIARFLIDTNAAARMNHPDIAARLSPLIETAVVATCATLDAEALYSARSPAEYEQLRADRRRAYEYLPTDDGHWQRAFDAQRELARTGRHRPVGIADLLTAVPACEQRLTPNVGSPSDHWANRDRQADTKHAPDVTGITQDRCPTVGHR